MAGRQGTIGRSRIASIVFSVRNSIESHRRRPRADHGGGDPYKLSGRRQTVRRQYGAEKCKWQREERVLNLDHFERGANIAEEGWHGDLVFSRAHEFARLFL